MKNIYSVISLGDILKHQLAKASKFYVATAMMNDYGLYFLQKAPKTCKTKLVVGIDLPTPVNVFEDLMKDTSLSLRVFQDEKKTFHPKVYLLQIDNQWQAFVGSANFTRGGFESNVEMTVASVDEEHISHLLDWFETVFNRGRKIDENWLSRYKEYLLASKELEDKQLSLLKHFKNSLINTEPLTNYDFAGQFFQHEHHNAFSGSKPRERNNPIVIQERMEVKKRLLDLHDALWPRLKTKKWNLDPHYDSSHIVSSHAHSQGTSDQLHALWLSYNRPGKEFKKLDPESTPLLQMRIQVLVRHLNVAIHLTVGKNGGGYFERMNILERLKRRDQSFLQNLQRELKGLPGTFYIEVAEDERNVHSFEDDNSLRDYLLKDDIERFYFIIGTAYSPDDPRLSEVAIVNTVLNDFENLIPIYKLFTVPVG